MEDVDVLRQARQHFIDQLKAHAPTMRPLIQRILSFDQDIGESTDFLAIFVEGITPSTEAAPGRTGAAGAGVRPQLRPDEFLGRSYFEAAREYLEKVGHAVSMEELLDALRRGGSPVGGKTPKKTLYISLVRSREFIPIPGHTGFVGLRKLYPNLKAVAERKTEKKGTAKKGKK